MRPSFTCGSLRLVCQLYSALHHILLTSRRCVPHTCCAHAGTVCLRSYFAIACSSRKPEEAEEAYELLYGVGKILVFLTFPLQRYTSEPFLHAQDLREAVVGIARHKQFLPAFVASLLDPALDPSPKDRTPKEMRAVDLVVTVLKQLAQVPNGAAADVAGTAELLVLAFEREGVLRLLAALCTLLARRDFERFTLTTLELVFCLLRGQDPDVLFASARRLARGQIAPAPTSFSASLTAVAGAGAAAGSGSSLNMSISIGGGVTTISPAKPSSGAGAGGRRSVSPNLPGAAPRMGAGASAMPSAPSAGAAASASTVKVITNRSSVAASTAARAADPLRALMAAERSAKAASVQAAGTMRHSRFGTMAYVPAAGGVAGASASAGGQDRRLVTGFRGDALGTGIVAAVASGHATTAVQRYHPGQARRAPPRRSKHAEIKPELRIEIEDGIGASKPVGKSGPAGAAAASVAAGGSLGPSDTFASSGTVDRARAALYAFTQALLAAPREAAVELPATGAVGAGAGAAGAAGPADDVIVIDDDDDAEAPLVPLRCLADAFKQRLVRADDETLEREDTLRYVHTASIMLGAHRVAEMQRVREQRAEAARLLTRAAAWKAAREARIRGRAEAILRTGGKTSAPVAQQVAPALASAATADAGVDDDDAELEAILAHVARKRAADSDAGTNTSVDVADGAAPAQASTAEAASPAELATAIASARAAMPPLTPQERLFEIVLACGVHVPGISADAVASLLDTFSLLKLASDGMQGSVDRKEWEAVGIYAAYAREILLFVHALLVGEGGGPGAQAGRDSHYSWRFAPGALATDLSGARASTATPAPARAPVDASGTPLSPGAAYATIASGAALGAMAAETVYTRRSGAVILPPAVPQGLDAEQSLAAETCPEESITSVLQDWQDRYGASVAATVFDAGAGSVALGSSGSGSGSTSSSDISKPRYRPAAVPVGGYDLGEALLDQLFRDGVIVTVIPLVLRHYEPGRLDASCIAALLEAAEYAVRLATRAAGMGLQTAGGGRSKGKGKRKGARFEDGDDDGEAGGGAGSASGDGGFGSLFELEKFICEFAHPAVVRATDTVLRSYRSNHPKISYFAVRLLDRLAALPNEYAGTDPQTGRPLTYETMLFHQSLLRTATIILKDRSAAAALAANAPSAGQYRDVIPWARRLGSSFARALATNHLMAIEALFWRPEKSAHADLARHYGAIDGHFARFSADSGKYEPAVAAAPGRAGAGGGGGGRVSAAAAERNAAEAQAAAYREARAAGQDADAEEEAVFRDDDEEDDALGRGGAGRRGGAAKRKRDFQARGNGRKKGGRSRRTDSDGSSSSSSGSSSGSASDGSDSGSTHSSTTDDTSTLSDSSGGSRGGKRARASDRKVRIARKKLSAAASGGASGSAAGASAHKRRRLARGVSSDQSSSGSDGDGGDGNAGTRSAPGSASRRPPARRRLAGSADRRSAAAGSGSVGSGSGGPWLPAEEAALRSLFPAYAALALAGVTGGPDHDAAATAASSDLSVAQESKAMAIAAQLLSREPELQQRRRSAAEVRTRCTALGLRITSIAASSSTGKESTSPAKNYLQPLHARVADGVAGLFVSLGRGDVSAAGAGASSSSSSNVAGAASSSEHGFADDDDDASYRDEGDADASGTAAAAWLADTLRRAAHARAAAEQRVAAEAAASHVTEAATQPAEAGAASTSQALAGADGDMDADAAPPASFAGFSQTGTSFQAAVAALLAGGTPPAHIPETALAAAAAQLGLQWQPSSGSTARPAQAPSGAAESGGSRGSSSSSAAGDAIAGAAAEAASASHSTALPELPDLPDIPVVPVLASHFTWFSSPAFTSLLTAVGVCRGGASAQQGEVWWRIPGAVPAAALYAAAEALSAAAAGRTLPSFQRVPTAEGSSAGGSGAPAAAAASATAKRNLQRLDRFAARHSASSSSSSNASNASSEASSDDAGGGVAGASAPADAASDDDVATARAAGRSAPRTKMAGAASALTDGSDGSDQDARVAAPRRLVRGAAAEQNVADTVAGPNSDGPGAGTGSAAAVRPTTARKKAIAIDDDDDDDGE